MSDKVLAKVAGREITEAEFHAYLQGIPREMCIRDSLNLAEPLENDMYEELTPLLQSIDKQNREKDAVANMRKEFSANVSHELKTPLTSISGYAEIMKNGLVKPEDMKTFSERIYNCLLYTSRCV